MLRKGDSPMLRVRLLFLGLALAGATMAAQDRWRDTFNVDKSALTDTGRGEYFVLEPGYRLRFAHGKDSLIVTVLNETKIVDGVKTRIVEERELSGDRIVEVSRN